MPVYRQIPVIRTLEHVRINGVYVRIKRVEFRGDVTAFPRKKETVRNNLVSVLGECP